MSYKSLCTEPLLSQAHTQTDIVYAHAHILCVCTYVCIHALTFGLLESLHTAASFLHTHTHTHRHMHTHVLYVCIHPVTFELQESLHRAPSFLLTHTYTHKHILYVYTHTYYTYTHTHTHTLELQESLHRATSLTSHPCWLSLCCIAGVRPPEEEGSAGGPRIPAVCMYVCMYVCVCMYV